MWASTPSLWLSPDMQSTPQMNWCLRAIVWLARNKKWGYLLYLQRLKWEAPVRTYLEFCSWDFEVLLVQTRRNFVVVQTVSSNKTNLFVLYSFLKDFSTTGGIYVKKANAPGWFVDLEICGGCSLFHIPPHGLKFSSCEFWHPDRNCLAAGSPFNSWLNSRNMSCHVLGFY